MTITEENMDEVFDKMVDEQANILMNEDQDIPSKESVKSVLCKFKKYINSMKFDLKCRQKAKEKGYGNYKIFKDGVVKGILQKIADVFNLTISVIGDVLTYAMQFISSIICRVINFTVDICKKIVNLITFNCGTQVA